MAMGEEPGGRQVWFLRWIRRCWSAPFFRFLVVGGLNTAFGYGVFALFIVLGVHYAIAALLSTVLGILFNFKTTGTLVFRSHDNALIAKFFAVYGVNYVLGVLILKAFKALGVNVLVTAAITTLPMAALAFLLMRRFVFGARGHGDQGQPPP
jgi:putative flippase GtrA